MHPGKAGELPEPPQLQDWEAAGRPNPEHRLLLCLRNQWPKHLWGVIDHEQRVEHAYKSAKNKMLRFQRSYCAIYHPAMLREQGEVGMANVISTDDAQLSEEEMDARICATEHAIFTEDKDVLAFMRPTPEGEEEEEEEDGAWAWAMDEQMER